MVRMVIALVVRGLLVALLVVLSACSGDPETPEEQIREMIAAGCYVPRYSHHSVPTYLR